MINQLIINILIIPLFFITFLLLILVSSLFQLIKKQPININFYQLLVNCLLLNIYLA